MNAFECVQRVYQMDGLRGFYRGMSASYAGISETVIHFVIYESIKRKLLESKARASMDEDEESVKDASDFVGMMLAAATSKTCATSIAYPHGNPAPLTYFFLPLTNSVEFSGKTKNCNLILPSVFFFFLPWIDMGHTTL